MNTVMIPNPCKPEILEAFTPGPWRAHYRTGFTASYVRANIVNSMGVSLACTSPLQALSTQMANARLIAAAPELLDACYDALGFLCSQPRYAHAAEIIGLLTAAIDKARAA